MKLKINKAYDLSSISVLPPHSRRSNAGPSGSKSSSIFGKSQAPMQLRSQQQLQQSQQSFSRGVSSQHGLFSSFSQNSQEEALTNELRLVSQERENSVKRNYILPPDIKIFQQFNAQVVRTRVQMFGMILECVQSDIMQVNKGTKEITLNMDSIQEKLIVHDNSLQLMNKGQEDIKAGVDGGFKYLSDQVKKNTNQENVKEIFSMISALSEKFDTQIMKLQSELQAWCKLLCGERPSRRSATTHSKALQATLSPKIEMGGWTSVKHKQPTSECRSLNKRCNKIKVSPTQLIQECRGVIESDEEIDGGFSCLLEDRGTCNFDVGNYSMEAAQENSERILRKARRKRKY
ncbi:unnamed protein product [Fraxinus pennsylvanica]|uniref:Uncharacterized protein n=1 Tax=Fraxinus pennsylvanica TaxID=56036 RepID=A0AAD1ZHS2_9LAMI|nr:unnamed protein product [Fraxinus pennsylvanica]